MSDSGDSEHNSNAVEQHDDQPSTSGKKIVPKSDKKKGKRGIIYLAYIPPGMNVEKIREIFQRFGEVNRIYLEPAKSRNNEGHAFVEGWIEFLKKKTAKQVAARLNGTQVGGRRRAIYYGSIWNMKYLHRFKWHNLTEQMNYEKSLRAQRLQMEIARAKRESDFYTEQHDELERRQRRNKKNATKSTADVDNDNNNIDDTVHQQTTTTTTNKQDAKKTGLASHYERRQRLTDEQQRDKQAKSRKKSSRKTSDQTDDNLGTNLLAKIFT